MEAATWRQLALFPVATDPIPLLRQAPPPAPPRQAARVEVEAAPMIQCAYCGGVLDREGLACSPCLVEAERARQVVDHWRHS
jgi:hypothetical protein